MDPVVVVLFVAGLGLLIVGAESLVRGASRLAVAFGISPLVVGLTVVAFGTSSPETAVTVQSSFAGQADIALGNVVGSNIFNVLVVLGFAAAILPLAVSGRLVRLEVPLLIGSSFLLLLLGLNGVIGRLDGLILFSGVVAYTAFAIYQSRQEERISRRRTEGRRERIGARAMLVQVALVVAGLGMLVLGSRWLVDGATVFARALGVSELIVGLTIVAAGTSLPEVATSVVAAVRGEREIAVGNAIGSCLFNILAVLGLAALVAPAGIDVSAAALSFDIPVMIATAVACLPIFFTGYEIARWEGLLFLAYYAAYTLYLFLNAAGHDALPAFNFVMLAFVIPITAVTLLVLSARSLKRRRRRAR